MKQILLYTLVFLIALPSFGQHQKQLQRSWIKMKAENLSANEIAPDTSYTRYTFTKANLYISLYPGWDDYIQNWSVTGDNITTRYDTYKIEELTDTSLTISLEGFRRFKFLSEEYLGSQEINLIPLGQYNNKPLYKANNFITPRYAKRTSLYNMIQKNVERFRIKKAAHFMATFVITQTGKLEHIQIVNGITEAFDGEIIKQLNKTAKDWKPAYYKGDPIQTQMFYEIKYLNSLTPYNFGELN